MKKNRIFKLLIPAFCLLLSLSLFACGPTDALVRFDTFGGNQIADLLVKTGDAVQSAPAAEKSGYTLGGWYKDENYNQLVQFPYKVEGDCTLYARWDEGKYRITFEPNGGSSVEAVEDYRNAPLAVPAKPVKDGYVFANWFLDEALTEKYEFLDVKMPAHDMKLYAGWTKLVSVGYLSEDGQIGSDSGLAGDKLSAPADPVREGYVFDGWFADEEFTTAFPFETFPKQDANAYAKWHVRNQSVTVTFLNGTVQVKTSTVKEGDALVYPANPVRTSDSDYYTFSGWTADAEGKTPFDSKTVPGASVTLYAAYDRLSAFALVTVKQSPYNEAAHAFVLKGNKLPADFFETNIPADLEPDGYLTESNLAFYPDSDVVASDMNLTVNLYSKGLSFRKILRHNVSGAIFYDDGTLTPSQAALYTTMGYSLSAYAYSGEVANLILPTYYAGKPVMRIEEKLFEGKNFGSVKLPGKLQIIQSYAFRNCANLTAVSLPDSTTNLEDGVFNGCTDLDNVTLSNSLFYVGYKVFENTAYLDRLRADNAGTTVYMGGDRVLYEFCGKLPTKQVVNISRPNTFAIAGGAFENQTNLYKLSITAPVVQIAKYAFRGCTGMVSLTLPKSLFSVQESAFEGCSSVPSVNLAECVNLIEAGRRAFAGMTALKSVEFPKTLASVGEELFEGCTALASVAQESDSALTYFSKGMFQNCSSLASIAAFDKLETVRENAFKNCTSLKSVTLGNLATASAIRSVEANAFAGCASLKRVLVNREPKENENKVKEGIVFAANALPSGAGYYIYVNKQYLDFYKTSFAGMNADYAAKLFEIDQNFPKVTLNYKEYQIDQDAEFDLLTLIRDTIIENISDVETPEAELTISVDSVKKGTNALSPIRGDLFDLSETGLYSVTFKVTDNYGKYVTATFVLNVVSKDY